jgi:hypothetical protein
MKDQEFHPAGELYEQMERGDPFARFLVKHRIGPWKLAAFAFLFGLLYVIVLPSFFGRLSKALGDWPTLVIVLIAFPIILAYYRWEPSTIRALFQALLGQIKGTRKKQTETLPHTKMFAHPLWFWTAILLGLVQSIYIYYDTMYHRSGWQSVNPLMSAVLIPMRFLSFYALVFIVTRHVLTIRVLNRFLDMYPVDALVLPLGRPSGLYVLAPYALSTGMIIGVVGLILGMTVLNIFNGVERMTAEFFIDLAIYAFAAPVLFLLPLWKAHKLMLDAKKQYAASLANLRSGKLSASDADRLEALEELYELTRKIPSWPLNFHTISRFGAAVILPVVVPLLLDVFTNMIASLLLMY